MVSAIDIAATCCCHFHSKGSRAAYIWSKEIRRNRSSYEKTDSRFRTKTPFFISPVARITSSMKNDTKGNGLWYTSMPRASSRPVSSFELATASEGQKKPKTKGPLEACAQWLNTVGLYSAWKVKIPPLET